MKFDWKDGLLFALGFGLSISVLVVLERGLGLRAGYSLTKLIGVGGALLGLWVLPRAGCAIVPRAARTVAR